MSDFAKKEPFPSNFAVAIACCMVAYETVENSSGIPELTELFSGYDKWCIIRKSPSCFLEHNPNGEQTKFLNGGSTNKGPAILEAANSFWIFSEIMSGSCKADLRLDDVKELGGEAHFSVKPWWKPLNKNSVLLLLYPASVNRSRRISAPTGDGRGDSWDCSISWAWGAAAFPLFIISPTDLAYMEILPTWSTCLAPFKSPAGFSLWIHPEKTAGSNIWDAY